MRATTVYPVRGKKLITKERHILKGMSLLRLRGYEHTPQELSLFIENFFLYYNDMYITENVSGKEICDLERARSIIDIFLICRYYYPECSLEKVRNIVHKHPKIAGHICGTIKRRVFRLRSHPKHSYWGMFGQHALDELSLTLNELIT